MGKRLPIIEDNFVNMLGQTIKPGDDVVSITNSWSNTVLKKAKYLGYRGERNKYVVVEQDRSRSVFRHKVTGEKYDWSFEPVGLKKPVYPRVYIGDFWSSRSNNPNYNQECKDYEVDSKAWNAALEEHKKNYHWVKESYKRLSQLQLNRIVPINMPLVELTKVDI